MAIKLIAVDMDGTCLDNRKRVPEKNLQALREADKARILVVPTTGRALRGYPAAIQNLPGLRYVISSNGARVTDLKTGQDLRSVLISCGDAAAFLRSLRREAVWTAIHKDGICIDRNWLPYVFRKLFYHGDFRESRRIFRLSRYLEECFAAVGEACGTAESKAEVGTSGVEKLQIFFLTKGARKRTMALVQQWPQFSCAMSHRHYIEITAAGASKGEALRELCTRLEISPSQVMAIGDSDNDISMLRFAGYPVAMGNAAEAVKKAAVEITGRNTECGVAQAVMKAVRGKKV